MSSLDDTHRMPFGQDVNSFLHIGFLDIGDQQARLDGQLGAQ